MTRGEKYGMVLVAVLVAVAITTSFVRDARTEHTTSEVVVQNGDSLWSIWEDVGYGRADRWIVETMNMNNMQTADIYPYDRLVVPVLKGE